MTETSEKPCLALVLPTVDGLPDDSPAREARATVRLTLPQAASWVDSGANEPVTADQIASALGAEQLAGLAQALGKAPAALAGDLAAQLPGVIDQATPESRAGRIPPEPDVLLVLFDGVPDNVTLREPEEGFFFGSDSSEAIRLG